VSFQIRHFVPTSFASDTGFSGVGTLAGVDAGAGAGSLFFLFCPGAAIAERLRAARETGMTTERVNGFMRLGFEGVEKLPLSEK
jgi:hypothetical protein